MKKIEGTCKGIKQEFDKILSSFKWASTAAGVHFTARGMNSPQSWSSQNRLVGLTWGPRHFPPTITTDTHTHTHTHTTPGHLCSSLNQFFPEDLTAGSLAALLDRSCNSTRKLARFLKLATTNSPSLFWEFTSKTGILQYPHPEVYCRLGFSQCPPYSDPWKKSLPLPPGMASHYPNSFSMSHGHWESHEGLCFPLCIGF